MQVSYVVIGMEGQVQLFFPHSQVKILMFLAYKCCHT